MNPPNTVPRVMKSRVDLKRVRNFFIGVSVIALLLLVFTLILISAFGITSFSRNQIKSDGTKVKVKFFGRRDADGELRSGTLYYSDGRRAKYAREADDDGSKFIRLSYRDGGVYEGGLDSLFRFDGIGRYESGREVRDGIFAAGAQISGSFMFDGSLYTGEFDGGLPSGNGIMRYADGDVYTGQFHEGKRSGEGELVFAVGGVYIGGFAKDMFEDDAATLKIFAGLDGSGAARYDVYVGMFSRGSMEGHGVYTYANGDRYEGEFQDNLFNGQGTYYWSSTNSWTGEFVNGKMR